MPYKDTELHAKYRQQRRIVRRIFLEEYKSARGCTDCGWNEHHAGLEFDHLSDKFLSVSVMLSYSMEKIMAEVAKCEVVCGTCHNMRSYRRRKDNMLELDKDFAVVV